MKKAIRLLAILGAAAALSGCQSFPLTSWMFKDRPNAGANRSALAGDTSGALDEGKAFLRDGNISAAVASFRIATLDPSARGDANNGLAVAYAKLGRPDLAERYFRAAIEIDPENSKFVANLLRLQQQVSLARRREAPASDGRAMAARSNAPDFVAREGLTGQVQRVSRAEVLVQAQPALAAAPAMAVVYRDAEATAAATDRDGKDERLAMATAADRRPITATIGE